MVTMPRSLRLWGLIGAVVAAAFSIWMFFFPESIPVYFAWNVQPRMTQAFIGAGYLFRTYFFLLFVFVTDWRLLRWSYRGNLLFTGALLLATLWHAEEMHWRTLAAHFWIIFYTMEPVIMHFAIPRGEADRGTPIKNGGPILPWFRRFLIVEVAIAGLFGLAMIINPEWLNTRWPWELNPFDARIVSAWWVGWAGWSAAIVLASDWDEVRLAAIGNLIFGVALTTVNFVFIEDFNYAHPTVRAYIIGVIVLTVGMAFFFWRQERQRLARHAAGPADRDSDAVRQ
jgi:hypothetical protein